MPWYDITGPVLCLLCGAVRSRALPYITVLSLSLRCCTVPRVMRAVRACTVLCALFCSALPFVVMEDLSIWMSSELCAACSVATIMSCCSYAVLCAVCMQLDAGHALVLWCALRRVWHFSAVRYAAWLCCAVLCYVCVCVVFQCA